MICRRKILPELIAWLKANPDKALQATAGPGSPSHVVGVFSQQQTGTRFQFVPYRGSAPMMQDLLGGQVDLIFYQAANSLPQVRERKIRAHAVTARQRLTSDPSIPTVDEAGLPGFYISIWHGLWVPKGTTKEIVTRLNAAVATAIDDPNVRSRLLGMGQEIPSPAEEDRPRHSARFRKPRSRNGGRSSKPPTSRSNDFTRCGVEEERHAPPSFSQPIDVKLHVGDRG